MNKLSIKRMNGLTKKKKKGFTLVELIIVIAIIAILAAMAIPRFGQARRDARISNDIAAAKNIQNTTSMLIANGAITQAQATAAATTPIVVGAAGVGTTISGRIDGNTNPTATTGSHFEVTITAAGNVEVSEDTTHTLLAPSTDATSSTYAGAIH